MAPCTRAASPDVRVTSKGDYACVVCGSLMQPTKMFAVTAEHGTPQNSGVGKNIRLISPACFMGREHVMAQAAQIFDQRIRNILIGEERGH